MIGNPDALGASSTQRLQFKLASIPSKPIEWRLNGHRIAEQSTGSFSWTPQVGTWRLQAKSGDLTEQVQFEVQLASSQLTRKGFSFDRPVIHR